MVLTIFLKLKINYLVKKKTDTTLTAELSATKESPSNAVESGHSDYLHPQKKSIFSWQCIVSQDI